MQSCKNTDDGFVFNNVAMTMGCDKRGMCRWRRLYTRGMCLPHIVVRGEIIVWFCMRYIYCGILYAMDKTRRSRDAPTVRLTMSQPLGVATNKVIMYPPNLVI